MYSFSCYFHCVAHRICRCMYVVVFAVSQIWVHICVYAKTMQCLMCGSVWSVHMHQGLFRVMGKEVFVPCTTSHHPPPSPSLVLTPTTPHHQHPSPSTLHHPSPSLTLTPTKPHHPTPFTTHQPPTIPHPSPHTCLTTCNNLIII